MDKNLAIVNNAVIPGSLAAVAKAQGVSIAETFLNCDAVVICDVSGSMSLHDARGGEMSRYEAACVELGQVQRALPGKTAVLSFSDNVKFCPGGVPEFMGGGTDMARALAFAHQVDAVKGMGFYLISDGEPNSEVGAIAEAAKFQNKINVIYVGPEGHSGGDFLQRLAQATGGIKLDRPLTRELGNTLQLLIGAKC